jgi:hypothetical protein
MFWQGGVIRVGKIISIEIFFVTLLCQDLHHPIGNPVFTVEITGMSGFAEKQLRIDFALCQGQACDSEHMGAIL